MGSMRTRQPNTTITSFQRWTTWTGTNELADTYLTQEQAPRFPHGWLKLSSSLGCPCYNWMDHNNKYAFPGNVTKIPTSANISPYLQIIKINNQPLPPLLIIHMYMPTHLEDTHLIPYLKNTITNQINAHPNHTHILCGDFNRDIALTGRQNNNTNTPPQE